MGVSIKGTQKLSVKMVEALFRLKIRLKIAPIASNGLNLVWDSLGEAEFGLLDGVKMYFMKRVMGLPDHIGTG